MKTNTNHGEYYTPIQMKITVDLEKIIEISDPIYTFNEIMDEVDLRKYLVVEGSKVGRPRLDSQKQILMQHLCGIKEIIWETTSCYPATMYKSEYVMNIYR